MLSSRLLLPLRRVVTSNNNIININSIINNSIKNNIINNSASSNSSSSSSSSIYKTSSSLSLHVNNIQRNISNNINSIINSCHINGLGLLESLLEGIWNIKRTFQPSLRRMKTKHGFLARVKTNSGKKVLNRRRMKNRRRLCA